MSSEEDTLLLSGPSIVNTGDSNLIVSSPKNIVFKGGTADDATSATDSDSMPTPSQHVMRTTPLSPSKSPRPKGVTRSPRKKGEKDEERTVTCKDCGFKVSRREARRAKACPNCSRKSEKKKKKKEKEKRRKASCPGDIVIGGPTGFAKRDLVLEDNTLVHHAGDNRSSPTRGRSASPSGTSSPRDTGADATMPVQRHRSSSAGSSHGLIPTMAEDDPAFAQMPEMKLSERVRMELFARRSRMFEMERELEELRSKLRKHEMKSGPSEWSMAVSESKIVLGRPTGLRRAFDAAAVDTKECEYVEGYHSVQFRELEKPPGRSRGDTREDILLAAKAVLMGDGGYTDDVAREVWGDATRRFRIMCGDDGSYLFIPKDVASESRIRSHPTTVKRVDE